jgi:IstB-like ATP binding protein
MNEDLEQLLENLKLKTIAARFDEMLAAAEQTGTLVPTLIAQLLRAEWHARQEQALEARITRANFPEPWTLESFPFKLQKGIKERQIRAFAELEFIPQAENIVFIGYEKEPVMEREWYMLLIRLRRVPQGLLIISPDLHIESSHVSNCGSRFQRGGFPGLTATSTFSRALRFVSRLARA